MEQDQDNDKTNHFITTLKYYLQLLCNDCVDFNSSVMLTGNIFVTVDAGNCIEYVVNEKVCKANGNEAVFMSNSFQCLPEKVRMEEIPEEELSVSFNNTRNELPMSIIESEANPKPIKNDPVAQYSSHTQDSSRDFKKHTKVSVSESKFKDGMKFFVNIF